LAPRIANLRRRYGVPSPGHRAVDHKPWVIRPRPEPFRTPTELRPKVAVGVHPEEDGRMKCLDGGRWYRLLGNHRRYTHGISVKEYQTE
jgi:hypothetical protein